MTAIQTVDDAKLALQKIFKATGDWAKVESSFAIIAHGEADENLTDLLGWYTKDTERVRWLTTAANEGYREGYALLWQGQILCLFNMLNEAYQQLVEQAEDDRIAAAQKDLDNNGGESKI